MPVPNYSPPLFSAIDATPTRVSTTSTGQQTIYGSYGIAFSPDGTSAAFFGEAVNLVDGDTNNCRDVFVKSLATGAVTRISTNAAGVQGNGDSVSPTFLPGGDKIAFISWANNLVAGDTNGLPDIFIKNLATGAITRASTFTDGSQFTVPEVYSTTGISAPEFSPDGTKMVFTFQSAGATVYIKDLITGTLTVAVEGSFAEGDRMPGAQFSPDGTKLLYRQYAPGESIPGLYIKDLASGAVTLVSTNAAGDPANTASEGARFSPDGTRIVFISGADNLVPGQTGGVFVKDLVSGAVTLIAVHGHAATFSPDGTKIAFASGSGLTPGSSNPFGDVYVKDLLTGDLVRVSLNSDGDPGYGVFELPVFSPDGLSVGFYGDELVKPDTNGSFEVYMARLNLPAAYVEGGPAVQIVPVAKALDPGSPNYNTGSLSAVITAGSVTGDRLSLAQSSAPGESIAISGNQVFVNGIMVGTFASTATSLVIGFNANAKNQTVELLTEAVRISSTSDEPTAAIRTITFTLVDGGGTEDGADDTTSFTRKVAFVPVHEQIIGTPGADSLTGGGGNDFIDGLGGADTMTGHAGDDVYVVDDAGDVVNEAGGGGADAVHAQVGYALAAGTSVEILAAANPAGTGAVNLAGNEFGQRILGNAGANLLTGGGGADTLDGGAGADTFVYSLVTDSTLAVRDTISRFQTGADKIDLRALAGSTVSWTDNAYGSGAHYSIVSVAVGSASMSIFVDGVVAISDFLLTPPPPPILGTAGNDALTGTAGADVIRGNAGNDSLTGLGGNDSLDGGLGADAMNGGAGHDTYYVDDIGDAVGGEAAGGGSDWVIANTSYRLAAGQQVELLTTYGSTTTAAINLTGNELANTIVGNAAANVLDGKGGADSLYGYAGNDIYYVDNIGDVIGGEGASGGSDWVIANTSYALRAGQHVELLTTYGSATTAAINLTGNEFANSLAGNAAANVLDGKGGIDVMWGYAGNDTYYVDNSGDRVAEAAGGGSDIVFANASYTLGAGQHIETLTTYGSTTTNAINLTGNEFANTIVGNAAANKIDGKGGADVMWGYAGNDTYFIDNAADSVAEGAGGGSDWIVTNVSYTLAAGQEIEQLTTYGSAAPLGVDLTGNAFANTIVGDDGGNTLDGKSGGDLLWGYAGADLFAFTTAPAADNIDRIGDFQAGVDEIVLENAVFAGLAPGALAAGAFRTGAAAMDADDRIIYDQATGRLFFDADGVGGAAAVQFATLTAGLAITAGDFTVI